jgi:hypothetical protein
MQRAGRVFILQHDSYPLQESARGFCFKRRIVMFKLLDFFALFDWVTPAANIVETVINDPTPLQTRSWTFFIPYREALAAGWNERDIRKELNARDAEFLIKSSGLPVVYDLPGSDNTPLLPSGQSTRRRSYRNWTWIPCLVGGKGCEQMSCADCGMCKVHCSCLD